MTVEELDRLLREDKKGFIMLDFGEFELIRSKIYLQEFCEYQQAKCFKVTAQSPLFNVVLRLMDIPKQDQGISRLASYNPRTQRLELYPKDAWFITSKLKLMQERSC